MLYFLNKLTFTGYIENKDYEKFNPVKSGLTDEFYYVNSEKLLKMICDIDNSYIIFITQTFRDVQMLVINLLDEFFLLAKEKIDY